jgi:hypothetical protein
MPLHALDDIGDAIDATKSLLVPVQFWQWLKLALVVFFIGGGGAGINSIQNVNGSGPSGQPSGPDQGFQLVGYLDGLLAPLDAVVLQTTGTDLPPEAQRLLAGAGLALLAGVVILLLLFLLYAFLSNFMEFVFVESLIEREVHVRRYFGGNLGNGLRLFGFRLSLDVVSLLAVAVLVYVVLVPVLGVELANPGTIDGGVIVRALALLSIPFFLGIVLLGLITGFTNVFVVPLMLQGDHGIVRGWRRLLASMTDAPKQYLAYLLFSVVLTIGVALFSVILIGIVGVMLLIPFGIVAALFWVVLGEGVTAFVLTGLVLAVWALLVFGVSLFVQVPLQSFLRYYAMLVLGDIDTAMDPIPEVRADIRADGGDASAAVESG